MSMMPLTSQGSMTDHADKLEGIQEQMLELHIDPEIHAMSGPDDESCQDISQAEQAFALLQAQQRSLQVTSLWCVV